MSIPTRNSIKILLLNPQNELCLMYADDPKTTSVDGKYHGRFWFCIGGEIEAGEDLQTAALREIYEETGIAKSNIELGPLVWFGEFDLVLNGVLTRLKQQFMVAKTIQTTVAMAAPTDWEQTVVQKVAWLSLDSIQHSTEIIYPVLLSQYLPDIIAGKYPSAPIEIDLAKKPS